MSGINGRTTISFRNLLQKSLKGIFKFDLCVHFICYVLLKKDIKIKEMQVLQIVRRNYEQRSKLQFKKAATKYTCACIIQRKWQLGGWESPNV